jgi:hypothetical protein
MKQLTKEQHFEVFTWLVKTAGCTLAKRFEKDFEPSCCDSCADGETRESEQIKPVEYPEKELSIENDLGASTEKDRLMYGVSYLEITNKGIRRIDPTTVRFLQPLTKENVTSVNFEKLEGLVGDSEPKYKHVVNFDIGNIPDLTWEQSTKLSELLSLGKIILTNQEGKQFLINTQDVKPSDIIAK